MWKRILVGVIALLGVVSVTYSFYDRSMSAAVNGEIGDVVTLGGESFKIVLKKEGSGVNKSDELIAMLMRFTHTNVYAGKQGSTGDSDKYLPGYAKEFADTWLPTLTTAERKMISKEPYPLNYFDDLGGKAATNPQLSNASLGVTGRWWIFYGRYYADALYVDENGYYSASYYHRSTDNFMPAIRLRDYMDVEYQPVYGNGLSYYQVKSNVKSGDVVGKLSITGAGNIGTVNLSLSPSASAPSGHENDYTLFQIPSTTSGEAVQISTAQDLGRGDYYFQITASDSEYLFDHDPCTVEVHLTVQPLQTTIAFDVPAQTAKSTTEAAKGWSETATATPDADDVEVTYEKVSGDIGLIDIDAKTGKITYTGGNAYGKVTIRATADDAPSNAVDNYVPSSTQKEIVIYAEVDGSVIPHANSSDTNIPTFTANDANIKTGGTIGTIKGAPGTPDNATGGTITYKYGLKSGENSSYFAVNATTGAITVKANLAVGDYHITVTVSDKWSTKEIPVTIKVGLAKADDLKFYESKTSNTVINTKSVSFTDKNVEVYATAKGSSNPNPVTYKIKDGSTNVIEINSTSGAVTIRGVGTVTIVATKKGITGQADATTELTFTVTAGEQNFIYTDSAGNELPKSGGNYTAYQEMYAPNKTFRLYTSGNPSGSTVTYRLKAGSPTDVISVDSNGTVHILNASLSSQIGKVIVEATSHDPSNQYADKTIELPITITKATLTVSFNQSSQTKKSIAEATDGWSELATATPSSGVKVTYSKSGGDVGLIDVDPDTGAISYRGANSYGKVTIRATADDDPADGHDNYESAYDEKEIVIYSEVDGSVTPDANSKDADIPTFAASDVNAKAGGRIGTIKGAPGTPDDITGSKITYTYGLKSSGDNSYFAVNATTGVITTKGNLAVGEYHITVTVSDKWSTKEIPVTIKIEIADAENLKFYESRTSNTVINTQTAKFTDKGVEVYATVKGSSNSNPVTYKIKDGSTNIITVNANSGAVTIHGAGTVTIVATKKGASGQADAVAELTFTVTAGDQNFIYTDSAGNELPKSGSNYNAYQEKYVPDKTFRLYTSGNPSGSTVTYQLKAGSPTDVISVDSDGTVHILNASLSSQIGKVIVEATSHDPSGNYADKTIELPITITRATLSVAFDQTDQTKKSIAEAANGWSETATATPSEGIKVTYSKSGGDVGLIDIDPDTGAITYRGSNSYGKVIIRATADDDPANGHDNYESAYGEKEIVVYSQVDGSVAPDANSSDANTPTFVASDANVKVGGTIGTIMGAPGTPDDVTGSKITYTYGISSNGDGGFFAVNPTTGVISTRANLTVGSFHIVVTVSDKWSTKEIPVTINVGVAKAEDLKFYESKTSNTVINTKSVIFTDTNVSVYATVKGTVNNNPVTYQIKDGSTDVIEVNSTSGAVTIHGVGTVTIVATKKGANGQADAVAELTFTVTAGEQNFIYTDSVGNELPKNGNYYRAYKETYAPDKTFPLYTAGSPAGSTVTYQLKAGSPTDVISVDSDGTVHILNASLNTQIGKVIVEATSHDPNGNYDDKTIELPIDIERGTRTIAFKENPITVINGSGQVTPVILVEGVEDTSGNPVIEIDPREDNSIAWTNDGATIEYQWDGEEGKDIQLHVAKPADRNYKIAEADGTLHILGAEESMLMLNTPSRIIYGSTFTIRSTQDDSMSTNVEYTFTVDGTTYISNPRVNGSQANFDALKCSGNVETTITVVRTADGEIPLSKKVKVKVLPKEIKIAIENKEKLRGEENPPLTVEDFTAQLVSWNGVKDVIQPNDVKLSTTATTGSKAGSYPIKGDANSLNKTYPNYSFSFTDGTLTINEENIEDDWYHLETDDGKAYHGDWTNQDVNIISDHNEYINVSPDQSTWKAGFIAISKEGNNEQSFWMKKDNGATTGEKKERIKIDKQAPKVKSIQAKDSNNKLQDIINKLSFGIFFKPGTSFTITTDDRNDQLEVSGTASIAYEIVKVQQEGRALEETIKKDTLAVTDEKASVTISETSGTYRVCVIPTDVAGNTGTESCHEVELKKINVDVDDDNDPDFNDPDGDGCPDLNIKWKDDSGRWVVINGDRDNDEIPDLNIDSDGDGKADLNVDTDNDGRPDLNLVMLKKADWKPTICVNVDEAKGIKEEYCTGTKVKAQINVDLDGNRVPDINVDTNGDMKADVNISRDGKEATLNIAKINTWKPDKNFTVKNTKFAYDTMKINPVLNIDINGDGKPDINVDVDDDGKADINIDTDGDNKPDINIDSDNDGRPDINIDLDDDGTADINIDTNRDNIPDIDIDSDGDGKPDVNVDTDGDGKADENIIDVKEWKPEHDAEDPFPYDTMEFEEKKELEDNGVKVEKPDGTFAVNIRLKVTDITKDKQTEVTEAAKDLIEDQSVIQVYDVKLLEDGKEIEPDGVLRVKLPVKKDVQNPQLLILNENGEYEKADATFEDGYLIVETERLGQFAIIGEIEEEVKEEPKEEEEKTDVKGDYYPGDNMGGVRTGDSTNIMMLMGIGSLSLGMMLWMAYKRKAEDE